MSELEPGATVMVASGWAMVHDAVVIRHTPTQVIVMVDGGRVMRFRKRDARYRAADIYPCLVQDTSFNRSHYAAMQAQWDKRENLRLEHQAHWPD